LCSFVLMRGEFCIYYILRQEFPGHGKFEGRVVGFDGRRYKVYYPQDGDDEVISESDFENSRFWMQSNKINV
jgi:hypothetical protein